jgi:dUTP pyrophosphatase
MSLNENEITIKELMELRQQLESQFDLIQETGNSDISDKIKEMFNIDLNDLDVEIDDLLNKVNLKFELLSDDETNQKIIPTYNYPSDSGFDLFNVGPHVVIQPFSRTLIPTGIKLDIPKGFEIQVRSKSGLALNQGLFVLNSPGTVDQGYTGEIKVILYNSTTEPINVSNMMKVGQAVLCPVVSGSRVLLVNKKVEDKDRSDNGFGSTGI